jgi:glycerol-3-phosphate dehydrogenase (NAD(P)+)
MHDQPQHQNVSTISVLGAGAWGTAFAIYLARAFPSRKVRIWTRHADEAEKLNHARENIRYLSGVSFPDGLTCSADFDEVIQSELLVLAVPSHALSELKQKLREKHVNAPVLILSKGFCLESLETVSVLPRFLYELWSDWPNSVMVLSGPNFAIEIAKGLPAAATLAAATLVEAERWSECLHGGNLRIYASDDRAGVSFGGAVKNILGIASGLSDGLGLGHNARASLITRGLAECMTLAQKMGCHAQTLFGLAGLGDVLLTCTGDLSRNRRVGLQLATGLPLSTILEQLGHVAEGVYAAPLLLRLADYHQCAMPLCRVVNAILDGSLLPRAAVDQLLARTPKTEWA